LSKKPKELVFLPLGGVGEIGMNLALYGLGSDGGGDWLCVDMGVAFAGDDLPGINLMVPDIGFLEEERKNLAGIVLTHAHEDHFGGVFALWPKLKVPVYATPFTAALMEAKRLGEPGAPEIPVKIVRQGSRVKIGPFDVEFVPVAHSIPECNSLVIRTPLGTVVHTGDWKLDPAPIIGKPTDEKKFREIGEEGVRAVICDSTNATRDGESPSETEVAASLKTIVMEAKGRVALTTFASNVARLRSAALAAAEAGREVVVAGRAMERVINVAREMHLLDGVPPFRGFDAFHSMPRDRVMVLLTGSQGEPRAALARIANDDHPEVSLDRGDTIIFSSRTIPGNEKAVNRLINSLITAGVQVITDRDRLVHVSGHPRRGELTRMYEWLKPEVVVPVHGEALHLHENAKLARSLGIKEVAECRNGDVVRLAPGPAQVIDQVEAGRVYQDGRIYIGEESRAIADRRKLAFAGIVSVAVALSGRGDLVGDPWIDMTGLPEQAGPKESMEDCVADAVDSAMSSLPKARRRDPAAVEQAIQRSVRGAVNNVWGKKPLCHVLVLQV
jgi:ribonuclease J